MTTITFNEVNGTAIITTNDWDYAVHRIADIATRFPDDVTVFENGELIQIQVPSRWVKINPPRCLSDDFRERLRENYIRNVLHHPYYHTGKDETGGLA